MLLAITAYHEFWWTPIAGIAFAVAWILGGGYLLRRALQKDVPRRRATLPHFAVASLLAGAAGIAGAAVVGLLVLTIGERAATNFRIPALIAALPTFAFMFFLVLHARFGLPVADTLRRGALALVAIFIFAGIAAAAVVFPGRRVRGREARRAMSRDQLKAIGRAILKYESALTTSPKTLHDLVDQKLLPSARALRCPSVPGRPVGYFYLPGAQSPGEKLRACELTSPETKGKRWVLFSDDPPTLLPVGPTEFREHLEREENKKFAKAFAEADKP